MPKKNTQSQIAKSNSNKTEHIQITAPEEEKVKHC